MHNHTGRSPRAVLVDDTQLRNLMFFRTPDVERVCTLSTMRSLIVYSVDGRLRYPAFQFDDLESAPWPSVLEVNRMLGIDSMRLLTPDERELTNRRAAMWWITPQHWVAPARLITPNISEELRTRAQQYRDGR